jgi:hypothetical protein
MFLKRLNSNQQRSGAAIIVLRVAIAMEILMLFFCVFKLKYVLSIIDEQDFSPEKFLIFTIIDAVVSLTYLIVFIACIVRFIRWFRRAYNNLHLIYSDLKYSEGWAAASWFVPVLFFYRPYIIMKELFYKTREFLENNNMQISQKSERIELNIWWFLWVLITVIGIADFIIGLNTFVIFDEWLESSISGIFMSLCLIPAEYLTIKLIRKYSKMETLIEELSNKS